MFILLTLLVRIKILRFTRWAWCRPFCRWSQSSWRHSDRSNRLRSNDTPIVISDLTLRNGNPSWPPRLSSFEDGRRPVWRRGQSVHRLELWWLVEISHWFDGCSRGKAATSFSIGDRFEAGSSTSISLISSVFGESGQPVLSGINRCSFAPPRNIFKMQFFIYFLLYCSTRKLTSKLSVGMVQWVFSPMFCTLHYFKIL